MVSLRGGYEAFVILVLLIAFLGGCGKVENQSKPITPVLEEKQLEAAEVIPRAISYTISAVGSLKTPENVIISQKR